MKYKPSLHLVNFFGTTLQDNLIKLLSSNATWEYIIPMPSCKANLKKRGFNHVLEMCRGLTNKKNEITILNCLEIREKKRQQARLPTNLKFIGFKKLIQINEKYKVKFAGKKVLLVDDVITSGATSLAAILELKKNGATEVDLLCLAVGRRWDIFRAKRSRLSIKK